MAVSISGNASRDAAIHTQPSSPHYLSVSPGPTSVLFSLKTPPISGGTPITSFVLQWRQSAEEQWEEVTVPVSELLVISSLKPYILYTVDLAALNAVGLGPFSHTSSIHTQGIMKIEGNSFSVLLKQINDSETPLLYFNVRYRQDTHNTLASYP
uniref:neural cell adhesion molecule 1-like n=1 Tax=Monopterus albus TaxID=43700 RepID=UPI0009B343A1|nr:neural cell adhesion molecule 1-like [Monopterus albus]